MATNDSFAQISAFCGSGKRAAVGAVLTAGLLVVWALLFFEIFSGACVPTVFSTSVANRCRGVELTTTDFVLGGASHYMAFAGLVVIPCGLVAAFLFLKVVPVWRVARRVGNEKRAYAIVKEPSLAKFSYSNPFSSLDIRVATHADQWHEWSAADYDRGYCSTAEVFSFATSCDADYEVEVVVSDSSTPPVGAIFGVEAPLPLTGGVARIRGGYTDVDVPLAQDFRSVTVFELAGNRLLIRLSPLEVDCAKVLLPR